MSNHEGEIVYNNFCLEHKCPQYIEWDLEICSPDGVTDGIYVCTSCQKVGQDYEIYSYPLDCEHLKEIKEFTKLWEQQRLWDKLKA